MRRAGVLAVSVLLPLAACGSSSDDDADAAPPSSAPTSELIDDATGEPAPTVVTGGTSASCVRWYSPQALREHAGFAFDGTVSEVRTESDPKVTGPDLVTARVVFVVDEWFAGGSGDETLVWMQQPVAVGDHLLVAGAPRWDGAPMEDLIAWPCGFTGPYAEERAEAWRAAFAGA